MLEELKWRCIKKDLPSEAECTPIINCLVKCIHPVHGLFLLPMAAEFGWGFSFVDRDKWSKNYYKNPQSSEAYDVEWTPLPDSFLSLVTFGDSDDPDIITDFGDDATLLLKKYEQSEIEKINN